MSVKESFHKLVKDKIAEGRWQLYKGCVSLQIYPQNSEIDYSIPDIDLGEDWFKIILDGVSLGSILLPNRGGMLRFKPSEVFDDYGKETYFHVYDEIIMLIPVEFD